MTTRQVPVCEECKELILDDQFRFDLSGAIDLQILRKKTIDDDGKLGQITETFDPGTYLCSYDCLSAFMNHIIENFQKLKYV